MSDAMYPSTGAPPLFSGLVSRRVALCVGAIVLLVWFLALDARHLLPSDEGRYAEIAREMFATGDWVTIRYNGLKYFEKPPLHMWMSALSFEAFGVGEWQARLWGALSGLAGVAAMTFAAKRWFGSRVALLSGLVLLASPTWNLASHFNALDISLSGALACVLAGVLVAQHPDTSKASRHRWMLASWAAMALAMLTKGLIGIVLPGLVLVVYTLIARDWRLWGRLSIASGLLCFLLITAPWFVLVSLRNPEFPWFFFVHEHWQRYTSEVHQRNAPPWYFIPQLLLGFLPWLGLSWGIQRAVRTEDPASNGFRPLLLLSVWVVAILVFFSLSSSKLPGYIIPVFPALAVLGGVALDKLDARAWSRQLVGMLIAATLALLASPLVGRLGANGEEPNPLYQRYALWIIGACALVWAGLLLARYLLRRDGTNRSQSVFQSIAAMALTFFGGATIGFVGHESLGRVSSGVDLVAPIESVLTPDMPIYGVRLLDHTLPFYLRRTTIMVESPDELEFGTQQEPQKWMPTLQAFVAAWSSGRKAIAIMSPETYAALQADRVTMFPIAEDERRVVVANFQKRPSP